MTEKSKRRVVIAGAGVRGLCFARGMLNRVKDYSEFAALYDTNSARMQGFNNLLGTNIPMYTDFNKMVEEIKPTSMIVCVPDYKHPELIEMGFAAGLEVFTEKPMAMNREGIEKIRALEEKYGKKVIVTFNYRFTPHSQALKKIMMQKPIGKIMSATFEWTLDLTHGQEYFHRWHAHLDKSGGLFVHKATHHFDLLNWILEDVPHSVYATGKRNVYGDAGTFRGKRCKGCEHRNNCWAVLKSTLDDADLNPGSDGNIFDELYFKAEHIDGYMRDGCCFDKEIDIYDTMNAVITYESGTVVNYCLNAFSPIAGWRMTFNGEHGRVEVGKYENATRPENLKDKDYIRIFHGTTRQNVTMEEYLFEQLATAHGGGDDAMYDLLLGPGGEDPLGLAAGSIAGARSALIGITANESVKSGKTEFIGL